MEQAQEHEHSEPNYLAIFGALCLLTLVSIVADFLPLSGTKLLLVGIVAVVATAKALFVMLYFMHLKFETVWEYALLGPALFLAVALIAGIFPDIVYHYYPVDVPQVR